MTHPVPPPAAPLTVDHWRASACGWGPAVRWYAVHTTFHEHAELHVHAQQWRRVLAPFTQLDPVPDEWLHLTMQGVGRRGEVKDADVETIADRATARLSRIEPFDLTFGAPEFTPEAVRFEPTPATPVAAARAEVRNAIASRWSEVPESADGFIPHVTIGYGNRLEDAGPIVEALTAADIPPVTIRITHIDLILLGRDEGMYTWDIAQPMPLKA